MAVEHQSPPATATFKGSDHIASARFDLLKQGSHAKLFHQALEEFGNLSLLAGGRGDIADGTRDFY
jgi:hypothetical protein